MCAAGVRPASGARERVTFDAQQDFSSHGASPSCAVEPPTSRVVRRRQTWPSAFMTGPSRECMEWLGEMGPSADDVYSCFAGCTSRALESGALPLTSASSRGRQSVNPRPAVIFTDRQTDALSDTYIFRGRGWNLGSQKSARRSYQSTLW